jgi:large subunit ribosomal protein L25
MNTLKAEKRDMSIKAKKLRREGFVTGNLFGRELEDSIPLKFDKAEIEKLLKIIVKMAKIYEIEYLLRRKVTKFKKKETKF